MKTKEVTYNYDAFDRRIGKHVDTDGNGTIDSSENYVYDGSDIVLVFDGSNNLTNRVLHGPLVDQVFAIEDSSSNNVLWALTDNQGTVRDVVDYDSGTDTTSVSNHIKYDAFGNITSESNSSIDFLYSYTGRIYDTDAELYYYRARWYDPLIGRFIGEDPLGFAAGDVNINRYVTNSPTNLTDPTGMDPQAETSSNSFARTGGTEVEFDSLVKKESKDTLGIGFVSDKRTKIAASYNELIYYDFIQINNESGVSSDKWRQARNDLQKWYNGSFSDVVISGHGNNQAVGAILDKDLKPGTDTYIFLKVLASKMKPNGTIELKACKCARGAQGITFLKKIARITNKNVIGYTENYAIKPNGWEILVTPKGKVTKVHDWGTFGSGLGHKKNK